MAWSASIYCMLPFSLCSCSLLYSGVCLWTLYCVSLVLFIWPLWAHNLVLYYIFCNCYCHFGVIVSNKPLKSKAAFYVLYIDSRSAPWCHFQYRISYSAMPHLKIVALHMLGCILSRKFKCNSTVYGRSLHFKSCMSLLEDVVFLPSTYFMTKNTPHQYR